MSPAEPAVLRWSVKASFREYIAALDDSIVETTDGARITASGKYQWPVICSDDTTIKCRGALRITGYDGMLDVELRSPQIDFDGQNVELKFSTLMGDAVVAKGRLLRADSQSPAEEEPLVLAALQITLPGSQILGGVYPPGTDLAALTVI